MEDSQKYKFRDSIATLDGSDVYDLIEEIMNFAENNRSFDLKFTLSIKRILWEKHFVSESQYNSLVNLYNSFKMHEHQKEKHEDE